MPFTGHCEKHIVGVDPDAVYPPRDWRLAQTGHPPWACFAMRLEGGLETQRVCARLFLQSNFAPRAFISFKIHIWPPGLGPGNSIPAAPAGAIWVIIMEQGKLYPL